MTLTAPVRVDVPLESAEPVKAPRTKRGLVMTLVLAVIALFWISPLALPITAPMPSKRSGVLKSVS